MEEFLIGKGTVGDGERIVRRKKIGDHRQQIGTGGDDRRGVGATWTPTDGAAVELVLFDPAVDQDFDSPGAMLAAVRHLTDWLIDQNHRNVLLDPAAGLYRQLAPLVLKPVLRSPKH